MALFSKKQSNLPRRRQQFNKQAASTSEDLGGRSAFRRNRTLTGSASSDVVGANEAKAQLKSTRVQAHELARQRRHIGAVLLIVLFGSAALYMIILQFTAGVVVKDSSAKISLGSSYQEAVQSYLASRPIERLRFLLNADQLNEHMRAHTPEVASIKVKGAAGFGKSMFVVKLRKPLAGWSIRGQQQYVDATGTAFTRNYYTSPSVQIIDNSGVQVEAGQAVASNRFLGFVGRAVGFAKAEGYAVAKVIIPKNSTRAVELRLKGVNYPVKLSVDRSAGEQIEDMARAIRWLHAQGKTPAYLDIRIGGKVFYK